MLGYVYEQDQLIGQFVAMMIPHCREYGFGPHIKAIGVVSGAGELIAGFVYHNYDPGAAIIEISGAGLPGSHWCTPLTLAKIYQYPFKQLGCQMIVQRVLASDTRLLRQFAALNYMLIKVPRLFGREQDGVLGLLTAEDWAANKICQRFKHHLDADALKEAA
jgi:RimJ/RimL family protein N-acetyltransferase